MLGSVMLQNDLSVEEGCMTRGWRLGVLAEDRKAGQQMWTIGGGGRGKRHAGLGKGRARAGGFCLDGEMRTSEQRHEEICGWRETEDRRELPRWSETMAGVG